MVRFIWVLNSRRNGLPEESCQHACLDRYSDFLNAFEARRREIRLIIFPFPSLFGTFASNCTLTISVVHSSRNMVSVKVCYLGFLISYVRLYSCHAWGSLCKGTKVGNSWRLQKRAIFMEMSVIRLIKHASKQWSTIKQQSKLYFHFDTEAL